jgi:hypothetical protein
MITKSEVEVSVRTRNNKKSMGRVQIEKWSQPIRLRRALKALGISWLLALISVFLPGAHFILVPSFFIGGPFVAYYYYKQESMVLGGKGICPNCSKPLEIVRMPAKWPQEDLCSACQTHVIIEPTSLI